jgi:hypothetical protein
VHYIDSDSQAFKVLLERIGGRLSQILADDNAADIKIVFSDFVYESQNIVIIRNARVAYLLFRVDV